MQLSARQRKTLASNLTKIQEHKQATMVDFCGSNITTGPMTMYMHKPTEYAYIKEDTVGKIEAVTGYKFEDLINSKIDPKTGEKTPHAKINGSVTASIKTNEALQRSQIKGALDNVYSLRLGGGMEITAPIGTRVIVIAPNEK